MKQMGLLRKPSQIILDIYKKILNNLEKQFVFDNENFSRLSSLRADKLQIKSFQGIF